MTKTQFRVLVASLALLILLMLWTVLPPTGWVILGLLAACAVIYWLGGVLMNAIDRVWRCR